MNKGLSSKLVSVIVVSASRTDLLLDCLRSVARQTHPHFECFVFLNGCDRGMALKWRRLFPRFFFEYSSANRLFCKPHNEGIRRSHGEFILCLNDDVILGPDFVSRALEPFGQDASIGSVNGRLLREDRRTIDTLGFSWSPSRKPLEKRRGRPCRAADKTAGYIFGANGAAALYRRKMLEEIRLGHEYFDEDYGIYYEDFDLAWRAQDAGWKAFYCPEASATHRRGASTRLKVRHRWPFLAGFALANLPGDLKIRQIRNRYATIIKNDSWGRLLLGLPWIVAYELALLIYLLVCDRPVLAAVVRDGAFVRRAWSKRRLRLSLKVNETQSVCQY